MYKRQALENVLVTINEVKGKETEVVTVVGCGGDRDRAKRPIMAKIACQYSDHVVLTSDNPRSENVEDILDDMEKGVDKEHEIKVLRIQNRQTAVKTAVKIAKPSSIILLAGKGHEKYQEINGEKFPFDDKKVLMDALSGSA